MMNYAFADQYAGGWFTDALINTLYEISDESAEDKWRKHSLRIVEFLAWEELFDGDSAKAYNEAVLIADTPLTFRTGGELPGAISLRAKRRRNT